MLQFVVIDMACHKQAMLLAIIDKPAPVFVRAQCMSIADHNQAALCSRQCHIQASPILQESHVSVIVRPHRRQDNQILFTPLESIDTEDRSENHTSEPPSLMR